MAVNLPVLPVVQAAADYLATINDCVIEASGTTTVTLPTAQSAPGQFYVVKNTGTGQVTIACSGSDTIDGSGTEIEIDTYDVLMVVSDTNSSWNIVSTSAISGGGGLVAVQNSPASSGMVLMTTGASTAKWQVPATGSSSDVQLNLANTNIEPLGSTPNAGHSGLAADASHVHEVPTLDQLGSAQGNIGMGGYRITSVGNGVGAQDAVTVSQIPQNLPPNGPAGGDLSGTYPNPSVSVTHLAAPLPIAQGGTGAVTEAAAQAALGIGTAGLANIDTNSGDVRALGTTSAGSTGLVSDAGHVHAMPRMSDLNSPAGNVGMNNFKLVNLAEGVAGTDAATVAQIPSTLPPNGLAGGDLEGSYPNPVVKSIQGQEIEQSPGGSVKFLRADGAWSAPPGGSGVSLDTSGADIQPLGVQAAGSTGLAADAGHVHAMPRLDQAGAPTANVSMNGKKVTSVANGTAANDAAAFGQIPLIDTLAGDIQPLGTAAAGSSGKVADAQHVHAMPGLDQVGAPAANVSMASKKVTNLANGTVATDAAAFGQIPTSLPPNGTASGDLSGSYPSPTVSRVNGLPVGTSPGGTTSFLRADGNWATPPGAGGATLDTTATDIQALGAQAAGAKGLAADAGHVHPMPRLDQLVAPQSTVGMNSQRLSGLANGSVSSDAATVGQLPTALPPNGMAGGDLSGTFPNPVVSKINGVTVSGTPASGQVLSATSSTAASWTTLAGASSNQAIPSSTSATTVANTTTATRVSSIVYAHNAAATVIRANIYGTFQSTPFSGAAPSLTVGLYLSSDSTFSSPLVTATLPTSGAANVTAGVFSLTFRVNSISSANGSVSMEGTAGASSSSLVPLLSTSWITNNPLWGALGVVLAVKWGTANTQNTLSVMGGSMETLV